MKAWKTNTWKTLIQLGFQEGYDFEMEVMNILGAMTYEYTDVEKVQVIKNWLDQDIYSIKAMRRNAEPERSPSLRCKP